MTARDSRISELEYSMQQLQVRRCPHCAVAVFLPWRPLASPHPPFSDEATCPHSISALSIPPQNQYQAATGELNRLRPQSQHVQTLEDRLSRESSQYKTLKARFEELERGFKAKSEDNMRLASELETARHNIGMGKLSWRCTLSHLGPSLSYFPPPPGTLSLPRPAWSPSQ